MARKPAKDNQDAAATEEQAFEVSSEVLAMADRCFAGAEEAARRNNYDYAITLYLQGLRYTPDDVERGHKPLFESAMRQKAAGKSKGWASKTSRMKANMLQMAGKKKDAFFEFERAMSGNPENHLELAQLAQMAKGLGFKQAAVFFADRAIEAARKSGKMSEALCVQAADIFEDQGLFKEALAALQDAEKLDKNETGRHLKRIRDLAARQTIGSGLEDADDFRKRIKDSDFAKSSARQKVVSAEDELAQQAEEMAKGLEENPDDVNLMITIGDTYARAQRNDDALKYYRKARTASGGADYRVKVKIDDIRMRQLRDELRSIDEQLKAKSDDEALKQARAEAVKKRNQFELEVFTERAAEYPTDMTVRYELGLRQYRSGQIDEAIGSFQLATRDPKRKIVALNMLGKCFFQKKLFTEAAAQFQAAIDAYEIQGDSIWKELRYNLGLTYEAMKKLEEAAECLSQIVMTDYQYRDAAKRLQGLRAAMESGGDSPETPGDVSMDITES